VVRHPALLLLCLASFMAVVHNTIITIALPSIRRDLGFSEADAGWVLNGYVLAFGGLLLLCGRAADLWGRRRAAGVLLLVCFFIAECRSVLIHSCASVGTEGGVRRWSGSG